MLGYGEAVFFDQKLLFSSGFVSFLFVLSFALNYYVSIFSFTRYHSVHKLLLLDLGGFHCFINFVGFYYFLIDHYGRGLDDCSSALMISLLAFLQCSSLTV